MIAALLSAPLAVLHAADAPRPNIVFFLIDDLGYADCGFNGGKDIQTPNIDKLAAAGAVLEAHYVQPVCSPTRAALMTGRYATRTGVYTIVRPRAEWGLPLQERTLATALREAGYETAITGKWHLGEFDRAYQPMARGFDHQYGHFFGMIDYFTHMRGQWHDWYRSSRSTISPRTSARTTTSPHKSPSVWPPCARSSPNCSQTPCRRATNRKSGSPTTGARQAASSPASARQPRKRWHWLCPCSRGP